MKTTTPMTQNKIAAILNWMYANRHEYDSATKLVEDTNIIFGLPDEWMDDETHWVWDIAVNSLED